MTDFQDKIILVSGAAKGIGLATAQAFARAGGTVVLADKDGDLAAARAADIVAEGGKADSLAVDVAVPDQVEQMIARVIDNYGRLDIAFNNAGFILDMTPTIDVTLEDWDRLIATNLRGTFLAMQAEIRVMLTQGEGIIVNCASIAGLKGSPGEGPYAATKHGMLGFTKSAALEYAKQGLRINAVCPGQIDTPMNDGLTHGDKKKSDEMVEKTQPIGRIGTAEEIADAVLWLASPGAKFTIGIGLSVDGGQSAM